MKNLINNYLLCEVESLLNFNPLTRGQILNSSDPFGLMHYIDSSTNVYVFKDSQNKNSCIKK